MAMTKKEKAEHDALFSNSASNARSGGLAHNPGLISTHSLVQSRHGRGLRIQHRLR